MKRLMTNRAAAGAVLSLVAMGGCNSGTVTDDAATPQKSATAATDEEARAKLKIALDSWTFGDDLPKFMKDHPELILAPSIDSDFKVLQYDLGVSRPSTEFKEAGEQFEFIANLTLQHKKTGKEVTKHVTYNVHRMKDGRWFICEAKEKQ